MQPQHSSSGRLAWLGITAVLAVSACGDEPPTGPDAAARPVLAQAIVSDPVGSAGGAAATAGVSLSAGAGTEIVYVSLPPDVLPDAQEAVIRNPRTGASTTVTITDGGFDPVPLIGGAGDTLEIDIPTADGTQTLAYMTVVPPERRPIVVRTEPPPKKKDVPLNVTMLIVFSEPIDSTTLTASTVGLFRESSGVAGQLEFLDLEHIKVVFVPSAPLTAGVTYRLAVTQGIEDLDGDALEAAVTVEFTTVASPLVASIELFPSLVDLVVDDTFQMTATARDVAGNVIENAPITWSTFDVSFLGDTVVFPVSPAGVLTAVTDGYFVVTARVDRPAAVDSAVASASVRITPRPAASVELAPSTVSLAVTQRVGLTAAVRDSTNRLARIPALTWASSDPAVTDVVDGGAVGWVLVEGLSSGTATITATSGPATGTATITVLSPASVEVTPPSASITVGQSVSLFATARDSLGVAISDVAVTWRTSDSSVATVRDSVGSARVTGARPGTVTITATCGTASGTATITVVSPAGASLNSAPGKIPAPPPDGRATRDVPQRPPAAASKPPPLARPM